MPYFSKIFIILFSLSIYLLSSIPIVSAEALCVASCELSHSPIMQSLTESYEKSTENPVELSKASASSAIRGVSSGTYDLALTARGQLHLKNGKTHPLENNVKLIHIGWMGVSPIVGLKNPIKNISLRGIKKILQGDISSWKDFGAQDEPIILCLREDANSSVGHLLRKNLFSDESYDLWANYLSFASADLLERKIESSHLAIGFSAFVEPGSDSLRSLSIDRKEATKASLVSGEYPLVAPLYLVVKRNISAKSEGFIKFLLSEKGQKELSKTGAINLSEGKKLKVKK